MTDPTRILRQDLETVRLLGVDVVPVSSRERSSAREDDGSSPRALPTPAAPVEVAPPSDAADDVRLLKEEALAALEARHAAECPLCTVVEGIDRIVFGEGSADAAIMFVGEAPGAEEDRQGRPFVGPAGRKLDDMIRAMGLAREDVYIANVLKSRPPNNRTPLPDEVARCAPFLYEQIAIIEPTVVVTLGGPASKLLLETDTGITRLRGQWSTIRVGDMDVDVMPTFHPAYLLRNYTRETRERMWSDLQAVMSRLS